MKIAIIYNRKHADGFGLATSLFKYMQGKEFNDQLQPAVFVSGELSHADFSGFEVAIVLGGDGTILDAGRYLAVLGIPLVGINLGKVGFLTEVEKGDAFQVVDRIIRNDFYLQERMMLDARVYHHGEEHAEFLALNDCVINNGGYSRAVELDLSIDRRPINSYQADGIIVSSPTGSTGYSLSAGGPIVMVDIDLMIVTPVCPHTFFSRPIVTSAECEVEIISRSSSGRSTLTIDGQDLYHLSQNDEVRITTSPKRLKMIRLNDHSFFDRIKDKLYSLK